MEQRDVKIAIPEGVHMRIAAQLVHKSQEIKSKVWICKGGNIAELNSIIQLLILGAGGGAEIRIVAEGEDEKQAVEKIAGFLTDGAGI